MTDPAVAYAPDANYEAYDLGVEMDIFLKADNGSDFLGLVWPGVTVYPGEYRLTAAKERKMLIVLSRLVQREDSGVLDAYVHYLLQQGYWPGHRWCLDRHE